ncbi:M23 family metallopeptidase [Chryseobacterium sp. 2987]|uniref:M23 family metallopeptidase n=1 Tax=Chryseobacterium sp. 2987 TaxID=2817767 RepID=UPI00286BB9CC|nr:M23 family metallopeptidase [Chryseobacterium sp. 2987]
MPYNKLHRSGKLCYDNSDGTFAQYYHLKENGVKVNLGDQVKKGDVIALSGNTGWCNGPHLHFVCYIPNLAE